MKSFMVISLLAMMIFIGGCGESSDSLRYCMVVVDGKEMRAPEAHWYLKFCNGNDADKKEVLERIKYNLEHRTGYSTVVAADCALSLLRGKDCLKPATQKELWELFMQQCFKPQQSGLTDLVIWEQREKSYYILDTSYQVFGQRPMPKDVLMDWNIISVKCWIDDKLIVDENNEFLSSKWCVSLEEAIPPKDILGYHVIKTKVILKNQTTNQLWEKENCWSLCIAKARDLKQDPF